MAIRVNGARLLWAGYEFGIGPPDDGMATVCGSLDEARLKADTDDGLVVKFRSVYVTEWFDTLPASEAW